MKTMTRTCAECGRELNPVWRFCGNCGADSTVNADPRPAATTNGKSATALGTPIEVITGHAESKRSWYRHPRVIATLIVLQVALLFGAGAYFHLQVRQDLGQTQQELRDTEASLEQSLASLDATQRELSQSESNLEQMTAQRDELQGRLSELDTELSGVRGSLQRAESRVELQAGQIDILKTCLDGVISALVYLSYGDDLSAIAALDAVDVSCRKAVELF